MLEAKTTGHHRAFKEAVDAFEAGGPMEAMVRGLEALQKSFGFQDRGENDAGQRLIQPDADWWYALSDVKRTKFTAAYREIGDRIQHMERDIKEKAKGPSDIPIVRESQAKASAQQLVTLVRAFREMEKVAKAIDKLLATEAKALKHGPYQLRAMPGVTRAIMDEALKWVDEAAALVEKRFPGATGGDLYVTTKVGGQNTGASYNKTKDSMYIAPSQFGNFATPLHPILHEMGHRFDEKKCPKELHKEVVALHMKGVYTSKYGETSPDENFAESFALYLLFPERMPPEMRAVFDKM